jgi:BlaI family transcriptional regulator, penicillinase repressor
VGYGKAFIREIRETFAEHRPAYMTIQTTVYRLESKRAVRRLRRISNGHRFEPIVSRDVTRHKLLDEILRFFRGPRPLMAQIAEAGKLLPEDVRELEKTIRNIDRQQNAERNRE